MQVPEGQPDSLPEEWQECMPEDLPEYTPENLLECMTGHLPGHMLENLPDRPIEPSSIRPGA